MNLYVKTYNQAAFAIPIQYQSTFWLLKYKALIMRISILAILLTASGLLMARTSDGQDLNKITVSIELKNATLKQAFKKIESLAKLAFTYKTNDVAGYHNISYQASNIPVARLLEELLKSTDLKYEQVSTNIIIKKVPRTNGPTFVSEIPFEGGIRGRVTDVDGAPLPNASIIVLEANKGTAADTKGEFVITGIKAGKYSLQISAVGFQTVIKNITIIDNENLELTLTLSANTEQMSEVVVTALGITRKQRSLGYSTQQVDGDKLTLTKEQNVLGSLAGKVAGVQVVGSSGANMGGTQKIKIRGVNSISGTDQPLIVVDGTPISNANFASSDRADYGNVGQDVNPEDIESINVLKGPTASALYGIRGQYGVIMITTKKRGKR